MDNVTLIGSAAALCSVSSFVPQATRIIRTRDTAAISTGMYAITVVGFTLWLTFGFLRGEWPIIVTNAICLVLAGFILLMKILPHPVKNRVADKLNILEK